MAWKGQLEQGHKFKEKLAACIFQVTNILYNSETNLVTLNLLKPSDFFTYHQVFNIQIFYTVLALR
jgi:hypothetical protein